MRTIFPKLCDILCLIVGPYLVAYHLLDFKYRWSPSHYYYTSDSRNGFAIGICLICLGFLMRAWKNDNK